MKRKGIYLLYRVLQAFGLPWLLLYFVFRALANPAYWRTLPQRFGFLPHPFRQTGPGSIWLHAVSVGEVLSCVEFLRALRLAFPQTRLFVSTSTLAGRALAGEKLAGLAHGVFYAPVDTVWALRRVLRALRPSLVIVAETEIWPNLFREVKRSGAGLATVNGRLSDRAYPRYRALRWFFRAVLPAADAILAQSEPIRQRFIALGAPPARTHAAGNFKYDFDARPASSDSPVRRLLDRVRPAQFWIAASTMPPAAPGDPDEDDAVLDAFSRLAPRHPGLLLMLVPRKPERFDDVARKLTAAGFRFLRRSHLSESDTLALPAVLLLDSIGELSGLFAAADIVFMGGTLARRGGHNILEPALFSKPVIIGPHMENFQAIADDFRAAGACVAIASAADLAGALEDLIETPERARETGRRARACAEAGRGATARAVALARELYPTHLPRYRSAQPWCAVAGLMARLWSWGGRRRQARDFSQRRQLNAPVISIGNLTLGGTGKTPCVLSLAAALRQRGRKPGILTRGYGRQSPEKQLVLAPGANVSATHTGDEPQLFLRSGLAPVGVGGDRFAAGVALLRDFAVDVLLLDDGFQHRRLARDVDIVLVDALNPFGGGSVFPLGRLREPMAGLERADLILLTRSESSDLGPAIVRQVRAWNSTAPIFQARLEPHAWVEHRTGRRFPTAEKPFATAGAFCGLGNPQGFHRTLERLGVPLADWLEFHDHHRYRPGELRHLAAQFRAKGATALVTTQKDAVNLCEGADDLLAPLPLYWLDVSLVVDHEEEFLDQIESRLSR
ncbi:MAG: tetraacyldisaccharide 4'-kinase [Acidobacteriia bacterium]|nr:tetraacyldisaccharide 4'-kinase [Terriglobia bacterium]